MRELERLGAGIIEQLRGQRLADLALNAVDIITRNLYERTADVRWWATDRAIVDAAAGHSPEARRFADKRLGVILKAYTVYLDLWLCDLEGRVIAHGRPDRYPGLLGSSVAQAPWFRDALATRSGDDYAVGEVAAEPLLGKAPVATFATAVREGGDGHGRPVGVLGVHFDWAPQAEFIIRGVRHAQGEAAPTRVMLLDRRNRVIAASDRRGLLSETFDLQGDGRDAGFYRLNDGSVVAFHRTLGYEGYDGQGWTGCIVQRPAV